MDSQAATLQNYGMDDTGKAVIPPTNFRVSSFYSNENWINSTVLRNLTTARVLPDPEICRAKADLPSFADCLVVRPFQCRYALQFGIEFFCRHPQRDEIVWRTTMHG